MKKLDKFMLAVAIIGTGLFYAVHMLFKAPEKLVMKILRREDK